MDELSEEAKALLRKVLSRGKVAYDSLNDTEKRAADELVRLGYVRLYLEPGGGRVGDALRLVSQVGIARGARYTYLCLAIILAVFVSLLYLSVRAFIMGYASVGAFFLVIDAVITYLIYLVLRRFYPRCLRFIP